MTATNNISTNPATNTQLASVKDRATLAKDFDQFLTLLTTQLQNQDPLSPLDSNEFTNQLVAFSGVEQQIKSNQMLEKLLNLSSISATNIGLGFIGLDVEYKGNSFGFDGSNSVNFAYNLPKTATKVNITILDEQGNGVFTAEGGKNFGRNDFLWDGTGSDGQIVDAGKYSIQIGAIDDSGSPINSITSLVPARVNGIETDGNGTVNLILASGEKVPMADVRKAQQPAS